MTIPEQARSQVKLLAERIEALKDCRVRLEALRTKQVCDIELELKQLVAEQEKWKNRMKLLANDMKEKRKTL